MSYTTPSITASGTTWAQLKTFGLAGDIEAVITANTFTQTQKNLLHAFKKAMFDRKIQDIYSAVTNYLRGAPIATADINQQLLDLSTALKAALAAVEEVNTLIAANVGTLATGPNDAGTSIRTKRTLP